MVTFEYQGIKFTENELCWAINEEIASNRYWAALKRYDKKPCGFNKNKMNIRWEQFVAINHICDINPQRRREILAAAIKLGMRKVEKLTKLNEEWADSIISNAF